MMENFKKEIAARIKRIERGQKFTKALKTKIKELGGLLTQAEAQGLIKYECLDVVYEVLRPKRTYYIRRTPHGRRMQPFSSQHVLRTFLDEKDSK